MTPKNESVFYFVELPVISGIVVSAFNSLLIDSHRDQRFSSSPHCPGRNFTPVFFIYFIYGDLTLGVMRRGVKPTCHRHIYCGRSKECVELYHLCPIRLLGSCLIKYRHNFFYKNFFTHFSLAGRSLAFLFAFCVTECFWLYGLMQPGRFNRSKVSRQNLTTNRVGWSHMTARFAL